MLFGGAPSPDCKRARIPELGALVLDRMNKSAMAEGYLCPVWQLCEELPIVSRVRYGTVR